MQVTTRYDSTQTQSQTGTSRSGTGTSFGAALAAASQNIAGGASTDTVKTAAEKKREAAQLTHDSDLAEFRDYLKKTPIEHMREAILKEMGLSEEELDALPAEEKNAIEKEIGRRITERLMGKDDGPADGSELPGVSAGSGTANSTSGLSRLLDAAGSDVIAQQLAAVLANSVPGAETTPAAT